MRCVFVTSPPAKILMGANRAPASHVPWGSSIRVGNRLIDTLKPVERADLLATAELIELSPGQVTHEPDGSYDFVVFPINLVLSGASSISAR
jgi:hypothetical protein